MNDVFESPNGIERNKKVQLVQAIIMMSGIASFYIYTKTHQKIMPNGIYYNKCCVHIVMKDGHLTYGNKTLPVKVITLKGGVTGVVKGAFTNDELQRADDPTTVFSRRDGKQFLLFVPVNGKETISVPPKIEISLGRETMKSV